MNREQQKAMFAKGTVARKRKRKSKTVRKPKTRNARTGRVVTRNTGKGIKMGSHGLKVYKGTKVYIAQSSDGGWRNSSKPEFRKQFVDAFTDLWNNDPAIKLLRKHVKDISMVYSANPKHGGTWDFSRKKVKLWDYPSLTPEYFKHTIVHEIVGHTFWDLARIWRREELVAFNKLALEMPPVNDYVKKGGEKKGWKTMNDEHDDFEQFKKRTEHIPEWDASEDESKEYGNLQDEFNNKRKTNGHETMTRYANEQHSAITEIVYEDKFGDSGEILVNDNQKNKLVEAWKKLHY